MSVALEGFINKSEDPPVWTGTWQFLKEKKTTLGFTYKLNENKLVPKDLFDYVSFLNEAPMPVVYKKSKGSSSSKANRGRGRPSFIPVPLTAFATDVNGSMAAPTTSAETTAVTTEVAQDTQLDDDSHGIKDEPVNEGVEEVDVNPAAQYIKITHSHPLMGLWEGSFNVKSATGEDPVAESFFFYSILGSELPLELSDLPPEPHFPYGLIRREPTGTTPTKTPIHPVAVAAHLEELSAVAGTSDSATSVNAASAVKATTPHISSSSSSSSATESSTHGGSSSSTLLATNPTSTAAHTPAAASGLSVNINDPTTGAANSSATAEGGSATNSALKLTPKKTLLSTYAANCVVLVGFGRNIFGRFSVAALYDESTGELRCEKKYLVSKFAAKRGRKSYAETSTNAALYDDMEGGLEGDMMGEGGVGDSLLLSGNRTQSTRHRYSSFNYADLIEDESSGSGLKRKRGLSSGLGVYGSKLKYDVTGALIDVKREQQQHMHAGSMGANALIGARNPDNDDPHCEYREAFQDCDTGEIYEGGWAYGMRYGRGVCLYADGLLYEGNWLQNREHGKGQLMTSDRQLIYSGDWLDGCFHGYGTYYFSNGDRYIGDWRESHRQGKGDYLFKNGCRYSGDWKDNKRHGKGVFVWPDESFYDGDWEHDKRTGRGLLELSSGFRYDGMWAHNLMEGKGNCTFPSGQQYQGTYKNGLREGRGSVIFAEGAVYEGRFKEDRFDGQGTIKITENVPGYEEGELMIPIQIQSELWRIHLKAGFGNDAH